MTDKLNKEYLGKVVRLAKEGIDGEKENAIRIVKKLCAKHDLNFEDVMNDTGIEEFYIDFKRGETQLVVQIIGRYAKAHRNDEILPSNGGQRLYFKCTKERYIETINAYSVLAHKFKEEKGILVESFEHAFFKKHQLYYQPKPEEIPDIVKELRERDKNKTAKDREADAKKERLAEAMTHGLDKVNIHKQLTGKI